jgi:uroporphyrinogen III methyltransferase/synthase
MVVELPTIEVVPSEDTSRLDRSIEKLSEYDWLIFTSVHGVCFFHDRLSTLGKPSWKPDSVKIAAIGPATATALEKLGWKPDYVPDEFLSEQIARGLGDVSGRRVLLPRADIASERLPDLLRKRGARVEEVVAYRTIIPASLSSDVVQSIFKQGLDFVTFTSPSTVRNLARAAETSLEILLKGVKVACIGPVTAEAAKALGLHVDIVARNHTIDDLVEAIVNENRTV